MPQLDSLLRIVVAQGADELRLGSDKAPSMFAAGVPKKLTIPATSTSTLVELFGELLDPSRHEQLASTGKLELRHEVDKLGAWKITLSKRPGAALDFDAIVKRATASALASPGAASSAPSRPIEPRPTPEPRPEPPLASSMELPAQVEHGEIDRLFALARPTEELARWIERAIAWGASDLHLAEGEPPVARIDGALRELDPTPLRGIDAQLNASFGVEALAPRREGKSVDLGFDLASGVRGRLNVYQTAGGIAAALRLLPAGLPSLAELGYPVSLDELAALPHGLVIVTGPTGSGKSTTLASLAQAILERRSALLITLEDPIERRLVARTGSLVRQRQVGRDVRSFHAGLRDALREDPDVLLIGEMRDPETIALALTAAETGHLVLTSLHSRSAPSAVERILDSCPAGQHAQIRSQLADALRAVLGQRLLPRASGSGRALAAEVLRGNASVANAVREGKLGTLKSAMQSGKGDGMIPLERHLAELVQRRVVTLDAAERAGCDLEALSQYLHVR